MASEKGPLSLQELIAFWDARDMFIGFSGNRDMEGGVELLRVSRHPEAQYVCSVFPNGLPKDRTDVKNVLRRQGNEPIALCYTSLLDGYERNVARQAAQLGHPYAMAIIGWLEGNYYWSKKAAEAGDRLGWNALGICLMDTHCPYDAVEAFKKSAQLGSCKGMINYARNGFATNDPERYVWLGRAFQKDRYATAILEEARQHLFNIQYATPVLVMIGRMLKGHVQGNMVGDRVIAMYEYCMDEARNGVLCWLLCARRLYTYKDVARLVGKEVWNDRDKYREQRAQK